MDDEAALADFTCQYEFINSIKQRKEEIAPLVNKRIRGSMFSYACLLSVAIDLGPDAVDYILDEFWHVMDPNLSRWNGFEQRHQEYAPRLLRLAGHPRYDIVTLMESSRLWGRIDDSLLVIMEKVIAIARPRSCLRFQCNNFPLFIAYYTNPQKVRKEMRIKHGYHSKDACQVFCFALLIDNKLLQFV